MTHSGSSLFIGKFQLILKNLATSGRSPPDLAWLLSGNGLLSITYPCPQESLPLDVVSR
jgi:hypothetical protein